MVCEYPFNPSNGMTSALENLEKNIRHYNKMGEDKKRTDFLNAEKLYFIMAFGNPRRTSLLIDSSIQGCCKHISQDEV